jgi:hypothetical protein
LRGPPQAVPLVCRCRCFGRVPLPARAAGSRGRSRRWCGHASLARRHRVSASLASLASSRSPRATVTQRQVHLSAQGPGHEGEVCSGYAVSAPCTTAAGVSANLQLDRHPFPGRAAGDLSELNRPSSLDGLVANLWRTTVRNALQPGQPASTNRARNDESPTFRTGFGRSLIR